MNKKKYYLYLLIDIILIIFSFLFFIYLKPASLRLYLPQYLKPFAGFLFLWFFVSLLGDKYSLYKKNIYELIKSIIKINFLILAIITFLIYFFNRFSYSRFIVLGTILLSTILELFGVLIYYFHKKSKQDFDYASTNKINPDTIHTVDDNNDEEISIEFPELADTELSIKDQLKEKYLLNQEKLYNFLENSIDLLKIPKSNSQIMKSHTLFNIENIEEESQFFFMNLHKVNDFRRLNRYFIKVNDNLITGGYFVNCVETINERERKIFSSFPIIISNIIFFFDFIFRRIFPKIPVLKEFYFAVTKGENRALSKAEVLGRLYFCGFRILSLIEIDNKLYFIAQKIKKPRSDISPSYGPLIKMKRVGKNREFIYIYKLRTMHPYSEYLQSYIHDKFDLEESGKFKNDYRITRWGKIFRKLWIDELPQLINFFRGDVTLVGVRALSEHYFDLYPEEVKELRTQFKPGLVPPFYVDMPNSFTEIVESEKKYLLKKKKYGFIIDFEYFFKAFHNIVFKHARSN